MSTALLMIRPGASFFLPDTPGVEIHPAVKPLDGESVTIKHFPHCFRETTLQASLQAAGISQLVVAGMMTHMCVDTTVRAAADRGFRCRLAADACATRDLSFNGETVKADSVQLAYLAGLNGLFTEVTSTVALCES